MNKYLITKCVDSFQHYSAYVTAEDPDKAIEYAQEHDNDLTWFDSGTSQYDDVDWYNIEPEEIPDDCEICAGMDLGDALRIVLDLAQGSIADPKEEPEAYKQHCTAIETVERRADYPSSMKERDTILAALRYWQNALTFFGEDRISKIDPGLYDIATNSKAHDLMTAKEIDGLCERINQ